MKQLPLYFIILFYYAANAQGGMQVAPGKLFFKVSSGQQSTKTVSVVNTSNTTMSVVCTFTDWVRDSLGNKIYKEPGTFRGSNTKYLKVFPSSAVLKPGESAKFEVSILLPNNCDSMVTNSMLFITQVDEKKIEEIKSDKKQAFMKFLVQMGVHVYNEPPQIQYKNLEIDRVYFNYDTSINVTYNKETKKKDTIINQTPQITAVIHNNGDLIGEGSVRFELTEKLSQKEYKLEPVGFNSLPGDRLLLVSKLNNNIPKGNYMVVTLLDFGLDQPLKVTESEIIIK